MTEKKSTQEVKEQIKSQMIKRALGYDYKEKVIEANKDGKPAKVKIFEKHMPGDAKLLIYVLTLIQNEEWGTKNENNISEPDGLLRLPNW